jgi:hypothetical protein
MKSLKLFAQLAKIDESRQEVWGVATAEVVDKDGEIFDYASSKPYFEAWSAEIAKATDGKSLGNVREMHVNSAVGKLVAIEFDDALKQISVGARIIDDAAWQKCVQGVYTGFSIGGQYMKAWDDGEFVRFTAKPAEISVVDNPCVPSAHFTAVKTDGSCEFRKFKTGEQTQMLETKDKEQLEKAHAYSASALSKVAEVEKSVVQLRDEMESNNKEVLKSLENLLQLLEKLVDPQVANGKVARTTVPSITVRKEDDGAGPGKDQGEKSVHDLVKQALQNPQRASNYLR